MEADWEVEIGPEAPIMEACWEGFVDLRLEPARAKQLPEASILPSLADALIQLNSTQLPFGMWTAKCDVWQLAKEDAIDPYELDATSTEAAFAWVCYIDLLPVSDQQWGHIWDRTTNMPLAAVNWCKSVCERLHSVTLRCCRADLVIRRAATTPEVTDVGVTAYLTACGATSNDAKLHLGTTLERFVRGIADGFAPQAKVK